MSQERITRVPSFPSVEAVRAAQQAKREQREADLYPRDGSRELFQLERDIAEMLGVRGGSLLLFNTGMSAVTDTLEIGRPTVGTTVLKGSQHYSQAGNYISDDLRSRGVSVFETNPGSIQDIKMALELRRPAIVFFETVTNGSEMATLDVEEFLQLEVLQHLDPLIILDNTLPTSTGIPLGEIMADSRRRIIGIESGTKFIGLNFEMCGLAYTYDANLLLHLRKRRQRTGSLLSASSVETIRSSTLQTAAEYNRRNRAIFKHTLRLARACLQSSGEGDKFVVVHPNLPTHPGGLYANSHSPDGIAPVFFIQPTDDACEHFYIAEKLWGNPTISSLCDLGQSFGFDRTRIWPDDNVPVVRISGGIYSEEDQSLLDEAFFKVLSALR